MANSLWKVTPNVQGDRDESVVQQLTLRDEDGEEVHSMFPSDICRDLPSYEWIGRLIPCECHCHQAPRALMSKV